MLTSGFLFYNSTLELSFYGEAYAPSVAARAANQADGLNRGGSRRQLTRYTVATLPISLNR